MKATVTMGAKHEIFLLLEYTRLDIRVLNECEIFAKSTKHCDMHIKPLQENLMESTQTDDHIADHAITEIVGLVSQSFGIEDNINTHITLNASLNGELTVCTNLVETDAGKHELANQNVKEKIRPINDARNTSARNNTQTNTIHKHFNTANWHQVLLSENKRKKPKLGDDKNVGIYNTINLGVKPKNSNNNFHKAKSKTNEPNIYEFNATDKPYCIRAFRKVIRTRQSLRLKTDADNGCEYDCNDIENADWGEIDGTKYECNVSKAADDDERKQKLTTICDLKFEKSIFHYDCGVYYSFSRDSNKTDGLQGLMKMDCDSVKNVRFNGECVTLLSVLCGQLTLITETNRHKKIETGYEIEIPHHTSYQLRNMCVEVCYLYFQVTRFGSQLE